MATTNSKRKRKVPWARRIISTVVLVALLVGVVFAGVKAVGWVMGVLSEEHARATDVATPKPVEILPCSADDLNVTLSPSAGVVDEGIGFELGVEIQNRGSIDCSVETSEVEIQLAQASTVVWSPSVCVPEWSRTQLLAAGESWSGTLAWNGHVYEGCEAVASDTGGATAPAGTYTLTALAPGGKTPQTVSIQVR